MLNLNLITLQAEKIKVKLKGFIANFGHIFGNKTKRPIQSGRSGPLKV